MHDQLVNHIIIFKQVFLFPKARFHLDNCIFRGCHVLVLLVSTRKRNHFPRGISNVYPRVPILHVNVIPFNGLFIDDILVNINPMHSRIRYRWLSPSGTLLQRKLTGLGGKCRSSLDWRLHPACLVLVRIVHSQHWHQQSSCGHRRIPKVLSSLFGPIDPVDKVVL